MSDVPERLVRPVKSKRIQAELPIESVEDDGQSGPVRSVGVSKVRYPITVTLFFFCLVVGIGFCLLGLSTNTTLRNIGLLGPILATIAYPIIGIVLKIPARAALRERFADNCYYLGFIFTQAALLFAFLPITFFGRPVSSEDVLGFFGMAVGASLSGLVARTMLTQMSGTIAEADDRVYNEVEELARQVTDRSQVVMAEFERLAHSVASVPQSMAAQLDTQLAAVNRSLGRYDASLQQEVASLEQAGRVGEAAQQAVAAYATNSNAFGEQVGAVRVSLEQLQSTIHERLGEALALVRDGGQSVTNAAAAFERLAGIDDDVSAIKANVASIAAVSQQVSTTAEGLSSEIETAVGGATQAMQVASAQGVEALKQVATQSAQDMVAASAGTSGDMRAQSAAFIAELNAATTTLSATLTQFRDELRALRQGHETEIVA